MRKKQARGSKETPNWRKYTTANTLGAQQSEKKTRAGAIRHAEQPYGTYNPQPQQNPNTNPSQRLNKDILLDSMLQSSVLQSSEKSQSFELTTPLPCEISYKLTSEAGRDQQK